MNISSNQSLRSLEPFVLLESDLPPNISRITNPPQSGMSKTIGIVYSIFGLIGLIGNVMVIFMILTVLRSPANRKSLYRPGYLLILSLSAIDLLFVSFMPYLLYDTFKGEWIFGPLLCPPLWASETLTKTVTAWLQLGLCIFCYISIAIPTKLSWVTDHRMAELYIGCCCTAFILIMIPFFIYSRLYAIIYPTANPARPYVVITTKCLFHPPELVLHVFMAVLFIMGYVIPTILQICFYSLIVGIVLRQKRRMRSKQTSMDFWRVTKRSMMLLAAFLTCWTPYWFIAIYNFFMPPKIAGDNAFVMIASYLIHALPYLHIALNPVLYVMLNRSVREAYTLASVKRASLFTNGATHLRQVTNRIGRSFGGSQQGEALLSMKLRSARRVESVNSRRQSESTALGTSSSLQKIAKTTANAALGRDRFYSDTSTLTRPLINHGPSPLASL